MIFKVSFSNSIRQGYQADSLSIHERHTGVERLRIDS